MYIINYVKHLTNLRHTKGIRARQRARDKTERAGKSYDNYDWLDLVVNRRLNNLKVVESNKYLDKNKLSKNEKLIDGLLTDNINYITVDVLNWQTHAIEMAIEGSNNNFSVSNSVSDEDLILELWDEIDSESKVNKVSAEEAEQAPNVERLPWVVTTRYGCLAGHWNLFKLE